MIARAQSLHEGIAREVAACNPDVVLSLLRSLGEAVVLTAYVIDHPDYAALLQEPATELPKGGPRRRSVQALISHCAAALPGLKGFYSELSDTSHFGPAALWRPYVLDHRDDGVVHANWCSHPRWRSEEEAMSACGQTLELADGIEFLLTRFYRRHLQPAPGAEGAGGR